MCGVALGLTGGGGSILAVPLLIYGAHIPIHQAIAISLLVVGATALIGFGSTIKTGEIELSAGIVFAITGMLFAPIGSYAGTFINGDLLIIAFSILMVLIGIWSWSKTKISDLNQPKQEKACRYLPNGKLYLTYKCQGMLLFSGMITGFLTGLFGVGGGFFIVPALLLSANMPIKKAITTSLLIIFLVSVSGFISHIKTTEIPWGIALYFILGGAVGIFGAIWIKNKISSAYLQKIFSTLLIVLGLAMLGYQMF